MEQFYLQVVSREKAGFLVTIFKGGLCCSSWIYWAGINLRQLLYRVRLFRSPSITAWVVSVGNITLGGTGKTPVVERLARLLHSRGRKVAVISRGYRRKTGPRLRRLREKISGAPTTRKVSDGERILLTARVAGDEPYMLASNLKEIPVLINRNRAKAAHYAEKRLKADTIILDDGFQHLGLKRDLDIVLIDANHPFGSGHLFPRGTLREPPRHLSRADIILVTKSEKADRERLRELLSQYNPTADLLFCRHRPLYLQDVRTSLRASLDYLNKTRVYSLAGIASPEGFENLLEELGAGVVARRRYADHHFYSQQDLLDILDHAWRVDAQALVTTEKDAARFGRLPAYGLPVYFLRVVIDTLEGEDDFDQALLDLLRRREKRKKSL